MDENTIKLPEDVAKVYKPAPGIVREIYHGSVGRVDLNKINMVAAKKLADAGVLLPMEKATEKEKKLG